MEIRKGEQAVRIATDGVSLEGDLGIPAGAQGIVLFAHGSGSSRFSTRNRHVADRLRASGLATLLMDLLTAQEESVEMYTQHLRFNINLLATRLSGVVEWVRTNADTRELRIGIFGASTGAAAALVAAAERPDDVHAVVSRGGRPDLADLVLDRVRAPTLLMVGGNDEIVVDLNRQAFAKLTNEKRMEIVPGATHLFEEPGALDEVARLAGDWFVEHLVGVSTAVK